MESLITYFPFSPFLCAKLNTEQHEELVPFVADFVPGGEADFEVNRIVELISG